MMADNRFPSGCFTKKQTQYLTEVAKSGRSNPSFLSDLEGAGPQADLEASLSKLIGKRYILTLSSCTAAIHATLLALGIGPGDEVIVTPYSWGQSVAPVLFTGATAVFADIDPETLALDPDSVRRRISPRTRAILPVHLFGWLADLHPLREMANEHNLALVVDAAHALGCQTTGDNASVPWGDAACFSLGRGKLVSGGEGGFLATDDESLYERVLLLTQHASRITRELGPGLGVCGELGLNYRMHPLAAVLALADLDVMRARLTHRRAVWQAFHDGLGCVPELMPVPRGKETAAWTAYGLPLTCLAKGKDCAVEREHLLDLANQSALPLRSGPVSIPLHLRLKTHRLPVTPHPTHSPGFCPVAEERCATKELWMLSALDMDGMSVKEVRSIGERLRELCSK